MVKQIKSDRVIKLFLNSLSTIVSDRFIDYESDTIRDAISIDIVVKKVFINIIKFPYYNKYVHCLVREFLNDYYDYSFVLLNSELSKIIKIDELE